MTHLSSNMDIDNIRERFLLSSKVNSRDVFIFSSFFSCLYHECIKINNDLPDVNDQEPINSSYLFYKNIIEDKELVSKVADTNITTETQCGKHEGPILKTAHKSQGRDNSNNNSNSTPQNIFNIQLSYDVN